LGGLSPRSWVTAIAVPLALLCATPALADFPYGSPPDYNLAGGVTPNDLSDDGNLWKFAATPESGSPYMNDPKELYGVRGAHVVDSSPTADTAWLQTVGRPEVAISVLDSGIRWDERETMLDLRKKFRLNAGELPAPNHTGAPLEPGVNCASYGSGNDQNGDGVFNVLDYLCDSRVTTNEPNSVGPTDLLDPQDLIIAFENGTDEDGNGFTDDIAGWDFLDDDNDAYDDVHYGHGTGEAKDSSAEANNPAGQAGACPNCMVVPLRVGDSFVADENNFAQATIYAVDNGIVVVQEALGTLNHSELADQAIDYAYRHGVTVIASAADEAAQHHNWPSNSSHVIVVNSVNQYDLAATPSNPSYVQLNGCTNFSTHITVAIPSSSCSSNATGLGAGFAGLVYSAAMNAQGHGNLSSHPNCERYNGQPCLITPNEVRQIMASGMIDTTDQADDLNFATQPERSCNPPTPGCTDPNALFADTTANRPEPSPLATTRSYPARKGFDEFYGYGRVNMARAVQTVAVGTMLPEAEITSPDWYAQVDPAKPAVDIRGQVYARGHAYSCKVYVAPGSEPNNGLATDLPPGDFQPVSSNWCDGGTHSSSFDGSLASIDIGVLKARFPADANNFDGREPPPGPPNLNGRPNTEPYGFTVRVIVTSVQGGQTLTGQDRRNLYLHRDKDMLPGFPKTLPGDGESSPVLVDLDGDNRNELVFGTADGIVHALRPDGTELPGWPVHTDALPLHTGGHAFHSGEVDRNASYSSVLASVAAADLDRDGTSEVVAANMSGKVYAWSADGALRWQREANIAFSGKPLQPHVNVRRGERYRTQHAFIASPVVADLDGNGGHPEIVAASMDRHVYAWDRNGDTVPGFPVLVVDPTKISSVDPQTDTPTFNANAGPDLNQGAIVDTPAVGDLNGDGKPEIAVGTNEEYAINQGNEPDYNAANFNAASVSLLSRIGGIRFGGVDNPLGGLANAHSRVYAIQPDGNAHAGGPYLPGWPAKIGLLQAEILPVVGEGISGAPVIGPVTCANGGAGNVVGLIPDGGPAYVLNRNGQSCYGQQNGKDIVLQTDFAATQTKFDTPAIPAVGHPAFGSLGGTMTFLAPATGLVRAFDIVANEYQGGQDFLAAWDASTGQFRPGFPAAVNDLQFLTGPSVGDLDGLPGEEAAGGTASLDLFAFNAAGEPFSPDWPKLTTDWTVADPALGSFGTQDTQSSARKVVVSLTRSGTLSVYGTDAPACSPSSWPRFHHDNANSGDFNRDAALPGKPYDLGVGTSTLTFRAPGDDLLCGTADHYEVVQSDDQITGANFSSQESVSGAPAPAAAGTLQTLTLPSVRKTYIGIRAVDEQGNVGPVATTRQQAGYARPRGATPLRTSLVPAYRECVGGNRQHGAPLAVNSCSPAQQASSRLTVGTLDANGQPAASVGSVLLQVHPGSISTPPNEADVAVTVSITDVRESGDLSDYTGELQATSPLRITDRQNGPTQSEPATTEDTSFPMTVPCSATGGGVGATCSLVSTFNALVPGAVVEGKRAIWQLAEIDVFDGGSDGVASTGPNALFARQGLFVP
jgi:subtilase family protein/FG-GAP repeat protein